MTSVLASLSTQRIITSRNPLIVLDRRDQAQEFLLLEFSCQSCTPCSPGPPRPRRPPPPPRGCRPSCPLQDGRPLVIMSASVALVSSVSDRSWAGRCGPPGPSSRYHSAPCWQYQRHCTMVDITTCLPPQATINAPNSKQTTKTFQLKRRSGLTVVKRPRYLLVVE